ncbi:MAG: TRAP transporter small permease subunit [Saprospiraceae bacterium]|nr:TRAP transporter small permease subunit [Saprospiraceae bacterium]
MNRIIRFIDLINSKIGVIAGWITSILVLLFTYDVLTRYFFNYTKVWVTEMEWHLYALIFLFGAAYTLKEDRHVRVDIWYNNQPEKKKALIDLLGGLLFLLPWTWVVIYTSFDYASNSFMQNEGSPNPGGLPYRFLIKGAITVGFILLLLQGIAQILKSVLILSNKSHQPINE